MPYQIRDFSWKPTLMNVGKVVKKLTPSCGPVIEPFVCGLKSNLVEFLSVGSLKVTMFSWFGYAPVAGCKMAWGARAIFKPSYEYPLDFLWDRQGHQYEKEDKEQFEKFLDYINLNVIRTLQKLSKYYSSSDSDKLVWHFEWPDDNNLLVVAQGSPNSSYGYFYLSVSLVERAKAPEVIRPRGYMTDEEREQKEREYTERMKKLDEEDRQYLQARKAFAKKANEENKKKLGNGPFKNPGQPLEKGDRVVLDVNQGKRDAVILSVVGDKALAQYFMPQGKGYYRIINIESHGTVRTVSEKKIPIKFKEAMNESNKTTVS